MLRIASPLRRCVSSLPAFFALLLATVSAHAFAAGTLGLIPQWSQLSPAANPGARSGAVMAYDGKELVLFGGTTAGIVGASAPFGDTWIWNGFNWTQVTGLTAGTTAPTPRVGAMVAYDQKNGKLVLFGGKDGSNTLLQDTWTWSNSTQTWTQAATAGVPARELGSMVYDPNANGGTGAIILFGGSGPSASLQDMYMWNGTAWSTLSPATVPPARAAAAMVYDSVRGNVVLFGGEAGSVSYGYNNLGINGINTLADTWTWNGSNWTSAGTLNPSPSARSFAGATFNAGTGQMVLMGGFPGGFSALADTWMWNGSAWTRTATTGPGNRAITSLAYDPATGQSVLFGGFNADANTWNLPTAGNLGSVSVGATGASIGTATLTFQAIGGPVSFGTGGDSGGPAKVRTLGSSSLGFTLGSTTCSSTTTLAANATCTVTVNFSPKYTGARSGAVQLLDGSNNVLATVPLYGVGTGPQVAFNPGTASTPGGGFTQPAGVAVDGDNNLYVTDTDGSTYSRVNRVPVGCTTSACVQTLVSYTAATGPATLSSVALDGAGNVYFTYSASGTGSVRMIAAGCTVSCTTTTLPGSYPGAFGLAIDGSSNIYVSSPVNNTVQQIPAGCAAASCVVTLGGGFSVPRGLAVDGSGNVYVADGHNYNFKMIPAGCTASSCVSTLASNGSGPGGIAVDAAGNVYMTSGHTVIGMTPGCASSACMTTLYTSSAYPGQITLDGSGNIYFGAYNGVAPVSELNRAAPPSVNFPTGTVAGTTDTTDGAKTVTIANIGNQTLSFPIPATGQQNPSISPDFTLTGTGATGACPVLTDSAMAAGTLAAGATCNDQVLFTPAATDFGSINGTLNIKSTNLNSTGVTQLVPLSGSSYATPVVSSISPTSGASIGGTSVTITGTGFLGATAVSFGGTPATTFTVNSDTSITATTPAHASGIVDITVVNPAATSTTSAADQFTYIAYPTVTSVSPTTGPTTGGTVVTITGTNFTGATAVNFGTTAAASYTLNSSTSITATSPVAASAGMVDITVTTPSGTTTTSAADQFTFVTPPTLTGINPVSGPLAGNTTVTATGTNFATGATTVSVGGSPAGSVNVTSPTQLTFTTPAHAIGQVNVTVSTAGGTTSPVTYTYQGTPGVTVQNVSGPTTSTVTLSATVTFVAGTTPTGAFTFSIAGDPNPVTASCSAASTTTETCTAPYTITQTANTYTITGSIAADANYTANSNTGTLTVTTLPTYTVTTLVDDASGVPANCVSGALGLGGGNGSCSLRDAIAAANSFSFAGGSAGSTINFLGSLANSTTPGTINITTGGTLAITQPVRIIGLGANALQLTGNNSAQIMTVSANSAISGLRFSAGKSSTVGGAINLTGGTLTLNNDYFLSNSGGGGGAISTGAAAGLLTVTNSTFAGNSATSKAAALFTAAGSGGLYLANSTFTSNTSPSGASAVSFAGASGKVINSTFANNNSTDTTAASEGALSAHSALTVSNSIFSGNTTSGAIGGGVTAIGGSVVTAGNNDYYNNTANSAAANCVGCTDTGSVTGDPKLTALGNSGGTLPTMLPQLGSAAVCAGSLALSTNPAAAGGNQGITDERGVAHSAGYCTAAGNELDAGAVQTRYALTFGTLASQLSSGVAVVPNPTVTVQENGNAVAGASVSLALSSGSALGGTSSASSAASGIATFTNLILPAGLSNNTLNATIAVGTVASGVTLTASSTSFSTLAVGPASLTNPTVGVAYTTSITVSNGTAPFTYAVTSGALPAGLSLTSGSGTLAGTPTAGGTFNFTITATDANGKTAFTAYTIVVAPPTIVVTPTTLGTLTYNTPVAAGAITFSASGGTANYTYTVSAGTLPAGLVLNQTTGALTGTPTAAGSYSFTIKATDSSTGTGSPYFGTVAISGTVNKAIATVNLGSLTQTYTGSTLSATATTVPSGLTVNFSYTQNGNPATPLNAGTYTVTGTISDLNYQGTNSATFTINKKPETVNLGSLTQTYTGSALSASATTSPDSGLNVVFTYTQGGNPVTAPTNAGIYTVTGTISDPNYQGTNSATFTIQKSTQTVTLGNLTQTYTGSPLSASATTSPVAGLTVVFTYTQGGNPVTAPTNAGTYTVTGTINDSNYQGMNSATFTIQKAIAPIVLSNLTPTYAGVPIAAIAKTTPAGLTVTLTYNGSTTAPTIVGTYAVVATVVDNNYQGTQNGSMTINRATLTITGPTVTRVYGADNPTLTGTYSGNVNNETFTVAVTTPATKTSPVVLGGYPVTPTVTGATLNNYNVVTVLGKLTVTPAPLTITAPSLSKAYGDVIPSLAGTYMYAVNGDTFTVTGTTTATASSPVVAGGYVITPQVTGANLSNYTVTAVNGTLTITPVGLTVIAPTLTKVYGDPLPSLNGTYTGAKGNDTFTVTGTTNATAASPVGTYTITPAVTGPNLSSYIVSYQTNPLTITPATLTITGPTVSKAYGAALPSLNGTYTGNVNGDTFTVSGTTAATAASPVLVGGYPIMPSVTGANLSNYTVVAVNGVLNITPVTLTITAPTVSKAYGDALPSLLGSYVGNVNGDTFTINGTTVATASSPVVAGGYVIVPVASGPNLSSYNIVAVNGTLTVTPVGLTVTAPTLSKVYGADLPSLNGSYSPTKNGDVFTVTGTTNATASSPVLAGGYTITPVVTGTNLSSYTVTYVTGKLFITPVALTITAPTLTKTYGAAVPSLNGTYSGALSGDTFTVTGSTTATASSPVGNYTVTPSVTGANLSNYNVVTVTGTLTISPATLTVTVNPATKVFATPNPTLSGTVSGVVAGDSITASYSTTATLNSPVGTYPITATLNASTATLANYTVINTPNVLTITPITPVITFTAIPSAVLLGDTVTLTATLSSSAGTPTGKVTFVDGAIVIATATLNGGVGAVSLSNLGAGAHTLTAVYAGDANFVTVTSLASTVLVQDFTLTTFNGTLPAQTAPLGGTATYQFALTPSAATFALPVTFSVTGLPTGASATFSPASLAAGSSATNVTMTVKVPSTLAQNRPGQSPFNPAAPLALALLSLPFVTWKRRKTIGVTRLLGVFLLLFAGVAGAVSMTGCAAASNAGGGSGTTARSYALTITATEGTLSRSITTTLNVQ